MQSQGVEGHKVCAVVSSSRSLSVHLSPDVRQVFILQELYIMNHERKLTQDKEDGLDL